MPELPEVETITNGLASLILNRKITKVTQYCQMLRKPLPDNLDTNLIHQQITKIYRRAKYILFTLSNQRTLIFHLGMTGKIVVYRHERDEVLKHDHLVLKLDSGEEVVFNDTRRFGLIDLVANDQMENYHLFSKSGPEPLSTKWNSDYLQSKLKNKQIAIKLALMDNSIVVGVGNIYASESLFAAKISPFRKCNELNAVEITQLVDAVQIILEQAIKAGGSTISDYVDASGQKGYFQLQWRVYGKEKHACLVCSSPILKIKQSGRSSFYCQHCQK